MPGKPLRPMKKKANPLHAKGIKEIDWKDTALLRTFISDRGKIRARRVTGLTPQQQRRGGARVRKAARGGLLPSPPAGRRAQQQRRVAPAIRNAREMALLPYPRAGRG